MSSPPVGFDDALVALASWALAAAGAWACVVLAAGLVEALTDGRVRGLARVGCPVSWRPAVLWLVGGAVVLGAGAPVHAATGPGELPPGDRLPVPTRPLDTGADAVTAPRTGPRSGPDPDVVGGPDVVVVRAGDSLWSIARAHEHDGASDVRVLRAVRAWHAANRSAVGPDPDLIHPGLRLRAPDPGEDLHR